MSTKLIEWTRNEYEYTIVFNEYTMNTNLGKSFSSATPTQTISQISFAEYGPFNRALLQKRPIIYTWYIYGSFLCFAWCCSNTYMRAKMICLALDNCTLKSINIQNVFAFYSSNILALFWNIFVCVRRRESGWVSEWVSERVSERVSEWVSEWVSGWVGEWEISEWVCE